tara:strand:- start:1350 stop:2258 length:909 start_codon:yes stop_codon:yes gene_type:complete
MKKLEIIGDYDYNDTQVLKRVANSIQLQLDINPELIRKWITTPEFSELLLQLNRECYRNIMDRDNPVMDRLVEASHADSLVNDCLFWEKEKCGQIMDECGNGYTKYCNQHKYLHPTKASKKSRDESKIDHYFVDKNANEIIEEQIFNVKFNMYLEITRNIAQKLENSFFKYIKELGYKEYFMDRSNADVLIEWLKSTPNAFRSNSAIFQKDLDDIKSQKAERSNRTMKTLRTLRTLKGRKTKSDKLKRAKGIVEDDDKNIKEGNKDDEQSDSNDRKMYIKFYALDNHDLDFDGCEIISRDML